MFFIMLGFLVFIAGFAINTPALTISRFSRPAKVVGLILLVLGALTASIRQIDAGQVGVISLFGNVSDRVLNAGLNFVNPLAAVK